MRYLSTRGAMEPAGFAEVLLEGLAPDGGLVVPASYPQLDPARRAAWAALDYPALAAAVLAVYADDLPAGVLARLCAETYTAAAFGSAAIAPLSPLEGLAPDLHLLELSHGPTLAFKDMAMQLLGRLFEFELARRGGRLNVLGATSGDTGSAAEYALRGRAGVRVFMLSPHGRMSAFQRAQMYTLLDPNIHNLAIEGTFDDCQDLVKTIAGDLAFKRRLQLGAVNSINWARVVAQVVYYVHAWLRVGGGGGEVDFCVPSGNFGNVLAGWIARQMGVPVGRLVVATNENDVLHEFFSTGVYRVRSAAQTHATSSPSMDISKASNFERFVFDLTGRDPAVVRELWWELDTRGGFDLSASPWAARLRDCGFVSGRSTHADRIATIRQVAGRCGRVIDPHTADGVKVALAHRRTGVPMVCLETASPCKFEQTVIEALGHPPERPAALRDLGERPQRFEVLPADPDAVRAVIERHAALPA